MRTYLQLFGGLAPLDVQKRARGGDGARSSTPGTTTSRRSASPTIASTSRASTQTNALMIADVRAARRGALRSRASSTICKGQAAAARPSALVFAFDLPARARRRRGRSRRGSTSCTAPSSATRRRSRRRSARARFFQLYRDIVARPRQGATRSRASPPTRPAWAAVCYGLVRHPEFHLY